MRSRCTFDVLVDIINYIRVILIFERSRMFFEQRLLYCTKITETRTKKHLKNEQRSRDAAAKKELIQVE